MANLTSTIHIDVLGDMRETIPSTEFMSALQELDHMEKHPDEYKSFHRVKELMEDLNSDDSVSYEKE